MRLRLQAALLACLVLAGCHTEPQPPITPGVVVGEYVYHSEDLRPLVRASDHEWDHLALRADGEYDLVQGGTTKPKTEMLGQWSIWNGGSDGPRVLVGERGYPVQIKGDEVRLLIDTDIGIWFAKVKSRQ